MTRERGANAARMPPPRNGLAPEDRVDVLRVHPQGALFTFMRNFLGVKTDQAVQAGVEALVRWDPQAATAAELRAMEQHLDELGLQVAQARGVRPRAARS